MIHNNNKNNNDDVYINDYDCDDENDDDDDYDDDDEFIDDTQLTHMVVFLSTDLSLHLFVLSRYFARHAVCGEIPLWNLP